MYLTAKQAKAAIGCNQKQLEEYIAAGLLQPYIVTKGSIVKVNDATQLASALLHPVDFPATEVEENYIDHFQDEAAYAIAKEWHFLDWECDSNIIDIKNKPPKGVNQQRALIILDVLAVLGCNRASITIPRDEIINACKKINPHLFSSKNQCRDGWEYGVANGLWAMKASKVKNPKGKNRK